MVRATEPEIHAQTSAEIGRLTTELGAERADKLRQRQELFATKAAGVVSSSGMPPDEVAAREFALARLNGFAPPGLRELYTGDRDQQLAIEIRGIDMCLDVLGRQNIVAQAAEVYRRAADGAGEWRSICRDLILTAEHLLAVEARARAFRAALGGVPENLPLARYIGHYSSLIDHRPSSDPLSRLRDEALSAKIVTAADIRNARDV